MNAWIVPRKGPMALTTLERPTLNPRHVRVRVRYAGVGFADIMAAAGGYPLAPKAPFSPGYEFTGVIEQKGAKADGPAVGTLVAGLLPRMNAYREFIDLDSAWIVPLPEGLDEKTAALLPLNYLTAEALLGLKASLPSGGSFVIHGAAGGVGSAVLELARNRGLKAYGTANVSKFAAVEQLGAIPLDASNWVAPLRRYEPYGVDAAFDSFGGESLERSWSILAPRGTLVSYGFSPTPGGGWSPMLKGAASVAIKNLLPNGRRARICGAPALCASHPGWYRETLIRLLNRAAAQELKPRLHAVLPWWEALEAHRLIARREARGKLLLDWTAADERATL